MASLKQRDGAAKTKISASQRIRYWRPADQRRRLGSSGELVDTDCLRGMIVVHNEKV